MKVFIIFIFSFFVLYNTQAQSYDNEISIGVICDTNTNENSKEVLLLLKNKIEQIATNSNISYSGSSTFVMYPTINIINEEIVETGMRNIYTIKAEIILYVIQLSNGMRIHSVTQQLQGCGYSKNAAIKDALQNINVKSDVYSNMINESKKRIYKYYEENHTNIILNAQTLATQQKYEAALAELAFFPPSLPSYPKIHTAMIDIYKKYQSSVCKKMMQEARAYVALKDYSSAIGILTRIDPQSICGKECIKLINEIKIHIDRAKKEEIEMQIQIMNNEIDMEKHRINTIKEIAQAYYNNQPKPADINIFRF